MAAHLPGCSAVISPVSFAAQLFSDDASNDFLILRYNFSNGIGRLCCWLEGVLIPGPVQQTVVPTVTLGGYWCIAWITATLHNVIQVNFLSSQVICTITGPKLFALHRSPLVDGAGQFS